MQKLQEKLYRINYKLNYNKTLITDIKYNKPIIKQTINLKKPFEKAYYVNPDPYILISIMLPLPKKHIVQF